MDKKTLKMNFIWVSMYLAQFIYSNWGHYFYVSWRGDRHFTWSSESRQGLAACSAKEVPSFLSYFKTLSVGPASEMELATSGSSFQALYRLSQWVIGSYLSYNSDLPSTDTK